MSTSNELPEAQPGGSAPALSDGEARELLEQSQAGHFVVQDDLIVYANPVLADMLGWPAD